MLHLLFALAVLVAAAETTHSNADEGDVVVGVEKRGVHVRGFGCDDNGKHDCSRCAASFIINCGRRRAVGDAGNNLKPQLPFH